MVEHFVYTENVSGSSPLLFNLKKNIIMSTINQLFLKKQKRLEKKKKN